MRIMAKTSLTPPTRHASIWHMPIAPEVINCLNSIRFAQCSPVATRMPKGAMARAMARWPNTSSDRDINEAKILGVQVLTGGCGLFDEPGLELGQFPHPCNRLVYIPNLIRVDHHTTIPAYFFSDDSTSRRGKRKDFARTPSLPASRHHRTAAPLTPPQQTQRRCPELSRGYPSTRS